MEECKTKELLKDANSVEKYVNDICHTDELIQKYIETRLVDIYENCSTTPCSCHMKIVFELCAIVNTIWGVMDRQGATCSPLPNLLMDFLPRFQVSIIHSDKLN